MSRLEMYRGTTFEFDITITQEGAPVNLTGKTLLFTAKYNVYDADEDAVISKSTGNGISILDAPAGLARITISDIDTLSLPLYSRTLHYDIKLVTPTGSRIVAHDLLTVIPAITQRTS